MELLTVLESIGIIAFSIAGALVAMEEEMDIYGIFVLALITAVGGGVIRDVVMDRGIPVLFVSYYVILISITTTVVTILFRNTIVKRKRLISIVDAIGLSVFAVDAGIKALEAGFNFPAFIFVATITGIGGGILRDMMTGRVPAVLKKEVYAVAALAGSVFLWFSYNSLGHTLSIYLSLSIIFGVRILCAYYNVHLPIFSLQTKNNEENKKSSH